MIDPTHTRRGYSPAFMPSVVGRSLGRPLRTERVGRGGQRLEHLLLGRKLILHAMVAAEPKRPTGQASQVGSVSRNHLRSLKASG